MKTRNPIRVLTFSFFLLLIGFFVTWQGGLLDRFFEPAEQPYQTIIGRIPDSVKAVPLDTTQPEHKETEQVFYTPPPRHDVYMAASSKVMIMPSSKSMKLNFQIDRPRVPSLFGLDPVPIKVKAKAKR